MTEPTAVAGPRGAHALAPEDHVALEHLLIELLWRVDHGERDRIHELYVEDCEVVEYEMSADGPRYLIKQKGMSATGPEIVNEASRSAVPDPGVDVRRMLHALTNLRFKADGPDRAVGHAIVIGFNDPDHEYVGTSLPRLVGEYEVTCVRTGGGWQFAKVAVHKAFGSWPR
jgi:hypothetical protein